jgi:N-acetylneuraminic acid mutarotase
VLVKKRILHLAIVIIVFWSSQIYISQFAEAETQYKWETLPDLPTPRSEVASSVIEDQVYVIGGFEGNGKASDKVEVFSIKENRWRKAPSLPRPLHHAAAISYNDKIFVLGGYNDGWISVNTVYEFDSVTEVWSENTRMPQDRAAFTAQIIDGKIYTIGGAKTTLVDGRIDFQIVEDTEYFDIESGKWNSVAPIPTPREHLASAVVDEKIYVIGGRSLNLQSHVGTNEVYDPDIDSWIMKSPMPTKRGGIAAASVEDMIFVFGGESESETFSEVEQYNAVTDEWHEIESIPTARHGLTASEVDRKILAIAGGRIPGLSVSDINEALIIRNSETTRIEITAIITNEDSIPELSLILPAAIVFTILFVAIIYLRRKTS